MLNKNDAEHVIGFSKNGVKKMLLSTKDAKCKCPKWEDILKNSTHSADFT